MARKTYEAGHDAPLAHLRNKKPTTPPKKQPDHRAHPGMSPAAAAAYHASKRKRAK